MAEKETPEVGKVIFSRDTLEEDNDLWDDTALINAYDKAVAKFKGQIAGDDEDEKPGKTNSKQKNKRSKHKKQKIRYWRVGDVCRVVYSGDGHAYTATVISVNEESETCKVRFMDYDDEEEYSMNQLKHVKMRKQKPGSETGSVSDGHSEVGSAHHHHGNDPGHAHHHHGNDPGHAHHSDGHAHHHAATDGHARSSRMHMPPPPPPDYMNASSRVTPPFNFPHAPWSSLKPSPNVPFIPPPPPPILGDEASDEDTEAMCSMLMAWYMSGYHTGYYQGLREGKRLAANHQSPYR